ncbi:MAG: FAD-dependent oxidoreductase [Spirochaetales bacterium]
MKHEIVIVGAGIAGLSCARTLAEAGQVPLILERSYQPGGRLATRELHGQSFDFGVVFGASSKADFLAWARDAGGDAWRSWPQLVEGEGTPCQPSSFHANTTRFALRGGLNRLAQAEAGRAVAAGAVLRCNAEVTALAPHAEGIELRLGGETLVARHVILALAPGQTRQLLATAGANPVALALIAVLDLYPSLPCLTVAAVYPEGVPVPTWDVAYPSDSRILQLASNEGAKHASGPTQAGPTTLVFQARSAWSQQHLGDEKATWTRELLADAARLWGDWVLSPIAARSHRWQYSRLDGSGTAQRPLVQPLGGGTLTLIGELFGPEAGLEGAWRSGRLAAGQLRS